MAIITKEIAICILYHVPFNDRNVKKYLRLLEGLENLEVCYMDNPLEPMILSNLKINRYPLRFKKYPAAIALNSIDVMPLAKKAEEEPKLTKKASVITAAKKTKGDKKTMLAHLPEILEFVNSVFLPYDPCNPTKYECREVTREEYLRFLDENSLIYQGPSKTLEHMLKLGGAILIDSPILELDFQLVNGKKKWSWTRRLFVLKEEFRMLILKNIVSSFSIHKNLLKAMKKQDYCIIGYACVPPGILDEETKDRYIKHACITLRGRGYADYVFASYDAHYDGSIYDRDQTKRNVWAQDRPFDGDTADMLQLITEKELVCLSVVGYFGLSSSSYEFKEFVENNPSIQMISIGSLSFSKTPSLYDRKSVLEDTQIMDIFDSKEHDCFLDRQNSVLNNTSGSRPV